MSAAGSDIKLSMDPYVIPPARLAEMAESKKSAELDQKERAMTMTASGISTLLKRNKYDPWEVALANIIGLRLWVGNPTTDAGHRNEGFIADGFQATYQKHIDPGVTLRQPAFKRHPVYRFIGASGDREMIDQDGEVIGGAEIKYRAGWRRDKPVDLQRWRGDSNYRDQVFTQMFVYDWPQNYLVVQSDVNADYWLYEWDKVWWQGAKGRLVDVYNTYLAWYWEDRSVDSTPQQWADMTAGIRGFVKDYIALFKEDPKGRYGPVATEDAEVFLKGLLAKRPHNPEDVKAMRAWRVKQQTRAAAAAVDVVMSS